LLRDQVKIELLRSLVVLDELLVDDASWLRVLSLTVPSSNKHSLVDSLVDDDQSDWRNTRNLVVERLECLLELTNLLVNNLASHLSSDTIPVDNNLGWLLPLVVVLEGLDGL
jgi:hypothetical protein